MNKVNWDEWEECLEEEYNKLKDTLIIFIEKENVNYYFKRKEKDVFENDIYKIKINDYSLDIVNKKTDELIGFTESIPLLIQAIEEGKKRFNWREE